MSFSLLSMNGFMFFLRWFHFLAGITWIGLLYYFNFVQGAFMNETDAPTKSQVTQKLVPRALWWFRYAALVTWLTGILYIGAQPSHDFANSWGVAILTGASLGTLMFLNVWLLIWRNQKVIIANAIDTAAGKPANPNVANCAARALVASRTNVLFSIPMLFFMGAASHLGIMVSPEANLKLLTLVFAAIILALEVNAIKGGLGPLKTVKGVIHCGLGLAAVLYVLAEILTK